MFKITKEKVKNLLRLLRYGLEDTAGSMTEPATFCVQQAVTRAIHGKDADSMGDGPKCVGHSVTNLGIHLNDSDWWDDDEDRASGLKDFAVAELGSNTISQAAFEELLVDKFNAKYSVEVDFDDLENNCANRAQLLDLISMTVEVLQQMKSPGCEYLYLCHPRKYSHLRPTIPEVSYPDMGKAQTKKSIHDV